MRHFHGLDLGKVLAGCDKLADPESQQLLRNAVEDIVAGRIKLVSVGSAPDTDISEALILIHGVVDGHQWIQPFHTYDQEEDNGWSETVLRMATRIFTDEEGPPEKAVRDKAVASDIRTLAVLIIGRTPTDSVTYAIGHHPLFTFGEGSSLVNIALEKMGFICKDGEKVN